MSSPGFSRVRVLYGSESESGPGFAVCQISLHKQFNRLNRTLQFLLINGNVAACLSRKLRLLTKSFFAFSR